MKLFLALIAILAVCTRLVDAFNMHSVRLASSTRRNMKMEIFEGNPIGKAVWDGVWKLPIMKKGKPGQSPTTFGDAANVLKGNILQLYGDEPSEDGAPIATGEVPDLLDGTLFLGLQRYYQEFGPVYKLLFGPKSFIVVSDPVIAKHILKENPGAYDKGVLAEILEPIMGKGLIPADPETWKVRRRAIVPGFHKQWYAAMCNVFADCNQPLIQKLNDASENGSTLNMETEFCSVALDIIGKTVFNYDFGSVTDESPVIQAVYTCLKEAESRSMTPLPYWNLPLANQVVPRLRRFNKDMDMLNNVLNDLIKNALETRNELDEEELQQRDYTKMENPSLLRFLVDMRGESVTSQQLRDDLMTMLIAGHETTAAVLTWALFELAQKPELMKKVRAEIDSVVGDRNPTFEDIPKLQLVRLIITESLRMYPEPPLLIRRALEDDVLPEGGAGFKTKIQRGTDIFIAVYNIHRSEEFWENPDEFDPERYLRPYKNEKQKDWAGYTPNMQTMYPNEVHTDYAYLPFGAGPRKCVGDQFACMEAAVTLCLVLRDFDFDFAIHPKQVGMTTGATIHTRNGLMMNVKKRVKTEVEIQTAIIGTNSTKVPLEKEIEEEVQEEVKEDALV
jgi:cytochrome P450